MPIRKPKILAASIPTGRFVICPVSDVVHPRTKLPVHPRMFAPVSQGPSGCFFAECFECRKKIFLPPFWEFNMGWTVADAPRIWAVFRPPASIALQPPR